MLGCVTAESLPSVTPESPSAPLSQVVTGSQQASERALDTPRAGEVILCQDSSPKLTAGNGLEQPGLMEAAQGRGWSWMVLKSRPTQTSPGFCETGETADLQCFIFRFLFCSWGSLGVSAVPAALALLCR